MTVIAAVRIDTRFDFVAHVIEGDIDDPRQPWVCVRTMSNTASSGWQGCWSKISPCHLGDVEAFINALARKIDESAQLGPYGPHLGETYFFPGWRTWGSGIPAPLVGVADPTRAVREITIGEFRFDR